MGESRVKSGFGQVDLEVDPVDPRVEEDDAPGFGELSWDLPESEPAVPPSQVQAVAIPTKPTDPPPSAQSGQHGVPSASRIEAKNDRVAAMREAYARGDAEGALAIAQSMESATNPPPPPSVGRRDYPDSTVALEIGVIEVDLSAYGDVDVPVETEDPVHEKDMTRIAPSASISLPPAAAPGLGSLTERHGIPRVLLTPQEISKLPIDHRAGFLLGVIDGMQTMEEILDVCAMPASEALELIRSLVDMGVIEIE